MTGDLAVLEASAGRLRDLVERLGPEDLRAQAYPSAWTVADVLSHLGSGAVIAALRVDAALGRGEVAAAPVWDEWNAKAPEAKAADALDADRALIQRLDALTEEERASFELALGPLTIDYGGYVRLRINEHAVHSWDVAVSFDASAGLAPDAVGIVLEALPMIARFTGKPSGSAMALTVRTTAPERHLVVDLGGERVSVARREGPGTPHDSDGAEDLELPAEAFVRLVYGRLDPDHTPPFIGAEADLDELRRAFPGV